MTNLRRLLAPAAILTTGGLLVAATPFHASARTVDERCVGHGPIPASSLAGGASEIGCSLVGRVVTSGRVSVVVPPAGMAVAGDGVGRRGDAVGLRVVNTGTTVRAVSGSGTGRTATSQRASDPPACKDRTFHLEHHKWVTRLRYHLNLTRMPSRYHATTVVRQTKVANGNMRKGRNTCGRPRLGTPPSRYLGRTKVRPNITTTSSSVTCGHYNTTNVVGFANLPAGLLGWTCYWWLNTGHMGAADIVMDTSGALTTHLPANCVNRWDFEGALTHEWGHAYGMAHTGSGHANLTMQHELKPCSTYARTLGLGDWLGMRKMYGAR